MPVDSRADVFALGLMLHHLTTGRRPEVLADLSRESVVRPLALVPGYPGDLEEVVMGAVDLDPARRVTAGELAAGLRAVLAGRGVEDGARRMADYVSGCEGAGMVEG